MLGAAFAGMAIEQSMLGAAHASANPLTARMGIPHGLAVGLMLPEVVRHNSELPACRRTFAEIARTSGLAGEEVHDGPATQGLMAFLESLSRRAAMSLTRAQESDLCDWSRLELAEEALDQWTGAFNPRSMASSGYRDLYDLALAKLATSEGR